VQTAVAAAIDCGETRHVDRPARAIVDLTRGILTRRLMRRLRAEADAEVDAIVDLIWRVLASKGSLKR
jgi:hypothetical protein